MKYKHAQSTIREVAMLDVCCQLRRRNMCITRLTAIIGFVHLARCTQTSVSSWYKDAVFNNFMPTSGYHPDVTHARSKRECGVHCEQKCGYLCNPECGQEWTCRSFFYAKDTSVCQLHNLVLTTTLGLSNMTSSQYYIREVPYLSCTCPADDSVYRTVKLEDASLFTYKVYRTPMVNQKDALGNCVADGAQLVRLTSRAKMDVLLQLANACPGYQELDYWVDLTYVGGEWVSSVGEPLPSDNNFWYVTEPKFPGFQRCARLKSGLELYTLADIYCSNLYSYICEQNCPIQ